MTVPAIWARDLTKSFPKAAEPSVKGLSFRIEPGETVAFLGPNGAGKSTTIKMLCGILRPSSGSAEIMGHEAGSKASNQLLGLVFGTRSQLYLHMTVAHCLDLSAEIYYLTGASKKQRITSLVEAFEIGRLLERRVRTLSLGERMRCEIVAALIHRPRVLLADEPTIGLDIIAKNSLRALIQDWQKTEQTTFMLTSHDLSDVEVLCTRCILIDHGEKRFDGTVEELKGQWKSLRRIRVTSATAAIPLLSSEKRFHSIVAESEYAHIYELMTESFPMAEGLFALSRHYGDALKDVSIGEVTLEEVLREHYARG